jgi:single-strand DNA-binding protein
MTPGGFLFLTYFYHLLGVGRPNNTMAISKNYVSLIGFLGGKPELRKTKTSKTPVTSFTMAMNEEYEDRQGKDVERTTWVKVRVWDRKAKAVCDYLDKGSLVEVEGKIVDAEAWEDEDGNLHAASVVEARNVRFLDRVQRDEDEDERPARRTSRTSSRRRDEDEDQRPARRSARRSTTRQRDEENEGDKDRVSEMLADLTPRERRELLRNLGKDSGTSRRRSSEYVEDADDDEGEPVEELSAGRQTRREKKVPFAKSR